MTHEMLIGLSRNAPLVPGADYYVVLDVDSTINRVYGYAKQGADYGYTRLRGVHPLLATISTPIAGPVIVGTRMRRGSAGSAKGAASFAISTARAAGITGVLLARMDSAFDSHATVAAGIRFSIMTNRLGRSGPRSRPPTPEPGCPPPTRTRSMTRLADSGSPNAEIAETSYTAYPSRRDPQITSG